MRLFCAIELRLWSLGAELGSKLQQNVQNARGKLLGFYVNFRPVIGIITKNQTVIQLQPNVCGPALCAGLLLLQGEDQVSGAQIFLAQN